MGWAMTRAERVQYASDIEEFGERVAYWWHQESQGWSALYELLYWAEVRKHAVSFKAPDQWAA